MRAQTRNPSILFVCSSHTRRLKVLVVVGAWKRGGSAEETKRIG